MAEVFDGYSYIGAQRTEGNETVYTTTGELVVVDLPDVTVKMPPRKPSKLLYYWRVMRWMWQHREEPNNRAKWRRMAREIGV